MTDTNKTSNCNMHEALVSYLYEEATPEAARRFEAHLEGCSACRQELAAFKRVRDMLQAWQLDDMPIVRVTTQERRSALTVLKELFTLTPIWVKAFGALAVAMLIIAVMGADVSITRDGFKLRASIFGNRAAPERVATEPTRSADGPTRAEVEVMVNQVIASRERQHRDELRADLVTLEAALRNTHSVELKRIAARVQEQRERIKTLELDIDRRESLDLTDVLFSQSAGDQKKPAAAEGGQ